MPEYYDELIELATNVNTANKNKKGMTAAPKFFRSARRIVYGDTGIQTNHYVGSADENLYFKAKITSGVAGGSEGATLFYDSPRDYCTHYLTCLTNAKYPKNDNFMIMREKIEAMLNEMSPVVDAWTNRRNEYLREIGAKLSAVNNAGEDIHRVDM